MRRHLPGLSSQQHDANNLEGGWRLANDSFHSAEISSYRVEFGKECTREAFIDNSHGDRRLGVAWRNVSTGKDRHTHGLKVSRRDKAKKDLCVIAFGSVWGIHFNCLAPLVGGDGNTG